MSRAIRIFARAARRLGTRRLLRGRARARCCDWRNRRLGRGLRGWAPREEDLRHPRKATRTAGGARRMTLLDGSILVTARALVARSVPVLTRRAPVLTRSVPVLTRRAPVLTRRAPVLTRSVPVL